MLVLNNLSSFLHYAAVLFIVQAPDIQISCHNARSLHLLRRSGFGETSLGPNIPLGAAALRRRRRRRHISPSLAGWLAGWMAGWLLHAYPLFSRKS